MSHRADVDAGAVLHVDAGFGDDVGHQRPARPAPLLDEGAHALLESSLASAASSGPGAAPAPRRAKDGSSVFLCLMHASTARTGDDVGDPRSRLFRPVPPRGTTRRRGPIDKVERQRTGGREQQAHGQVARHAARSTMPPSSGNLPTRGSVRPKVASSHAMTMSAPSTISKPPPSEAADARDNRYVKGGAERDAAEAAQVAACRPDTRTAVLGVRFLHIGTDRERRAPPAPVRTTQRTSLRVSNLFPDLDQALLGRPMDSIPCAAAGRW